MYNLRQLQYVRETIKITRILKRNIIFMCFGFFFVLAYLSIHCSKFKSMRMLVQKVVAFQIRSGKKKNEFQAYYEHCTFAFVKKKNETNSEKKVKKRFDRGVWNGNIHHYIRRNHSLYFELAKKNRWKTHKKDQIHSHFHLFCECVETNCVYCVSK